jgi:hypothetical protein
MGTSNQNKKFRFYDLILYANRSSSSVRQLATALGCRRWRDDLPSRYVRRRPYFRGSKSPLVVNWGSSRPADWLRDPRFQIRPRWINPPESCLRAIDKRAFFRTFARDGATEGIPVLRATEDRNVALGWLKEGFGVVVRKTLTGSSGAGIVVVQAGHTVGAVPRLPEAPLYTRYYPKSHEFRAHVWQGKVIDFTQKKLSVMSEGADRTIRSHDNGWIFAHSDLDIDGRGIEQMGKASSDCLNILGLDFGAVDILARLGQTEWNTPRRLSGFRICEVNTGPGLENTQTIQAYTKAILSSYAAKV